MAESGRPEEALPYAQRAYDLISKIAAADPRNSLYQRSLAVRKLWLGNVIRLTGDPVKAQLYCREALTALQELSSADPQSGEKRSDVAAALHRLAEAELATGDARSALAQERKALAILHDMPEQSQDENLRKQVVQSTITGGEAELTLGQTSEAIARFEAAANLAEKVANDDPDQAYNRLDRARVNTRLAQALAANSQCSEAEPILQQSIEEWKSLREIGMVAPTELGQAEALKVAARKCRP